MICTECGSSIEMDDPRVGRLLEENATRLGFQMERRVVEVEGTCADCVQAGLGSTASVL